MDPIRIGPGTETPNSSRPGRGRRLLISLLILTSFIGAAWAYATGRIGQDHRATLPPEPSELTNLPEGIAVTAEPVTIRKLKRTIDSVGTLYGFEEVVVSAKVEGRVLRIRHDVSDRIAPDELLVELDPTDHQLAVEQARSNLQVELAKLGLQQPSDVHFELEKVPTVQLAREKRELARLKMERVQSLAERQATTQEGVDNAVSEFRMAGAEYENQMLMAKSGLATIRARQAALAIAQQQLADCNVRAPVPQQNVSGADVARPYVMTRRTIAEGTFVRVGDEICRLVIDGILKLRLQVPERHSAEIILGQHVQVYTAASSEPYSGTVTMINPAVDTKTRTFQVEVQVVNNRPGLKPGGFAKAVIEISEDPEARTVPLAAMIRYAGVIKLFTMAHGQAHEVQFVPGVQTSEWVEVASPRIARDSIVITSGQYNLSEGTKVFLRKDREASSSEETPPAGSTEQP